MPATIIQRRIGETGNPLVVTLENDDDTLTIPADATVKLAATNTATSATLINGATVAITDRAARTVTYNWADADLAAAGEFELVWAIIAADTKPTYVPDAKEKRVRLIVW